jgi:molybdopterin-guanine dinucleotide biosynthesis protein A
MKAAGFVLTGGQSSRMGRDKALLPAGGQTLCEHIGDVVSQVASPVFLVGHPERYAHLKYPCLEDLHPGLGPLCGLETALTASAADWNVIVSCDIVNIQADWLRALLAKARPCAVAQDPAGNIQPLCGVYHRECRAIVSKALSEGRLRAMDLLKELNAAAVPVSEMILNVNTPEQYGRIQPLH